MSISQPGPPGVSRARRRVSSSRWGGGLAVEKASEISRRRGRRSSPGVAVVMRSSGASGDVLDGGEPVLEPVAGPVDRDDVAVVQEPVEDGGGQDLVAEDLAPFAEAFVRGQQRRALLVAFR